MGFVRYRPWWCLWMPRYRLHAGKVFTLRYMGQDEYDDLWRSQEQGPQLVMSTPERTWWLYLSRFYWTDEPDLQREDVQALVHQRLRRRQQQLDRAHALMAVGTEDRRAARTGIPQDVKLAVWRQFGGQCANCGSPELIEYDHVIPLALGGSNTARNLQLLCADCNRAKGASLTEPRVDPRHRPSMEGRAPAVAPVPTPPGWYADPSGAHQFRWWDGGRWTEHVHSAPTLQSG